MFSKLRAQIKGVFDATLPFEILEEFRPFEQKYLDEKGSLYPEVNDKLVVIDLTVKMGAKISLGIALVLALAVIIGGSYSNEGLCHPVFF